MFFTGMWYSHPNIMKDLQTGPQQTLGTGTRWMWAPIVTWWETWLQLSGRSEDRNIVHTFKLKIFEIT